MGRTEKKIKNLLIKLNFMIKEDGRRNSNFHRLESKVDEVDKKISDLREILKSILEKVI